MANLLNAVDQQIVDYLRAHPGSRVREIRWNTGLLRATISNALIRLLARGVLQRERVRTIPRKKKIEQPAGPAPVSNRFRYRIDPAWVSPPAAAVDGSPDEAVDGSPDEALGEKRRPRQVWRVQAIGTDAEHQAWMEKNRPKPKASRRLCDGRIAS